MIKHKFIVTFTLHLSLFKKIFMNKCSNIRFVVFDIQYCIVFIDWIFYFWIFITVFIGICFIFILISAFDYSGGYFNPALATSLKYGCLGTSFIEHVIVYWVGACAGSIASLRVYKSPFVQQYMEQYKEKTL